MTRLIPSTTHRKATRQRLGSGGRAAVRLPTATSNGPILITPLSQAVAHKLTGTHFSIIEVKPMDEDDALSLSQ
jgi:hypothetical protein